MRQLPSDLLSRSKPFNGFSSPVETLWLTLTPTRGLDALGSTDDESSCTHSHTQLQAEDGALPEAQRELREEARRRARHQAPRLHLERARDVARGGAAGDRLGGTVPQVRHLQHYKEECDKRDVKFCHDGDIFLRFYLALQAIGRHRDASWFLARIVGSSGADRFVDFLVEELKSTGADLSAAEVCQYLVAAIEVGAASSSTA